MIYLLYLFFSSLGVFAFAEGYLGQGQASIIELLSKNSYLLLAVHRALSVFMENPNHIFLMGLLMSPPLHSSCHYFVAINQQVVLDAGER